MIWFKPYKVSEISWPFPENMGSFIGIKVEELGNDFLSATMPVSEKTIQPFGVLHGGASVVLAESLGSIAGNLVVDPENFYCVGQSINASHMRPVPLGGKVTGIARPIHLGKSSHVWQIDIEDDKGKPVCSSRLTLAVVARK